MTPDRAVVGVYGDVLDFAEALRQLQERGLSKLRVYSPVGLEGLERFFPRRGSPIRWFMLVAAIIGCIIAFIMCIGSAEYYGLTVGGKLPATPIPYCVVGFEMLILFAGITGFFMIFAMGDLRADAPSPGYDPRFNEDKYGVRIDGSAEELASATEVLKATGAEEVHD